MVNNAIAETAIDDSGSNDDKNKTGSYNCDIIAILPFSLSALWPL